MGMMLICPDGTLGISQVKALKDDDLPKILQKYDPVFHGIGKIHDHKNDKEVQGKFTLKPHAVPVAQKPSQIPYHLRDVTKKWLDKCIEEDIYEMVADDEPVT